MLAKSNLHSIQTFISQELIDLGITHKKFKAIVNEKERYEQLKEIVRNIKSDDEEDELNENSRNISKYSRNI